MEDENSWVFDSLICFLNGPVWNAPLESFIEEKSLIFDPEIQENSKYREVFEEFKNLVDFMLGNFMEDMGITSQQFKTACAKATQDGISLHFDQNIFKQIWAANDYDMFQHMMSQKNIELQLQALELIEQKYGITPKVFVTDNVEEENETEETKAEIAPKVSTLEKEILKEVVKNFQSTPDDEMNGDSEELEHLIEDKQVLEETLKKSMENKASTKHVTINDKKIDTVPPPVVTISGGSTPTPSHVTEVETPSAQKEVNNWEMEKRRQYLKAQRDKLVAMKKQERKKRLLVAEEDPAPGKKVRPKSAKKAAESILEGHTATVTQPQQLLIRRALVEKLKSEVMGVK